MFSKGVSWGGVEILIPGGVWGSNKKNFPGSLSLAMTPCNTPLIFTLIQVHSAIVPNEAAKIISECFNSSSCHAVIT